MFAPVAHMDTVRLVISMAAQKKWMIFQLGVKSAFLHGELSEEVFVEQPPGYVKRGDEHKVYKLKKALYGLKQAPRAWYSRIESYFAKEGFEKCPYEHSLFIKVKEGGKILIICLYVDDLIEGFEKCPYEHSLFIKVKDGGKILIICLYVDDLIFTGNDESMFDEFKYSMMHEFDMTDLGRMRYFLALEVMQEPEGIFICQR